MADWRTSCQGPVYLHLIFRQPQSAEENAIRKPDNPLSASLLRALCTLIEEANVTRAARRLGLSQPATSLILKQLREIFGDPLLVRGRAGMKATERALALHADAANVLMEIDGLLAGPEEFDPSTSHQSFTVALPDHIMPLKFNRFMQEFRRQAPSARLTLRSLGSDYDFQGALASGSLDLVISNWPTPPPNLRISVLFEDEFVCMVDRDHAFTRTPPTADEYLSANHIAPADYAIMQRGVVETHLTQLKLERQRRVVISYFSMAPYLLIGTDLVFTVTRHFAEYFTDVLPVAIIRSPIDYPRIQFYQLWHERSQHSPSHIWLRRLLAQMR